MTKIIHETGLQIKERKASRHKSCNESKKREICGHKRKSQGAKHKENKITRNNLADGLRRMQKMRDEDQRHWKKMKEEGIFSEQRKLEEK